LGARSKAPFQLLCTREALIWRTEELARTACDALERKWTDLLSGEASRESDQIKPHVGAIEELS